MIRHSLNTMTRSQLRNHGQTPLTFHQHLLRTSQVLGPEQLIHLLFLLKENQTLHLLDRPQKTDLTSRSRCPRNVKLSQLMVIMRSRDLKIISHLTIHPLQLRRHHAALDALLAPQNDTQIMK